MTYKGFKIGRAADGEIENNPFYKSVYLVQLAMYFI